MSYRRVCLDTKGEQCQICDTTEDIVVHHVDGDRGNNAIDNLVPVCKSCHGKIHTGAEGYEGWFEQLAESARIYDGSPTLRDKENVNMYLPDGVHSDLQLLYAELSLQWRREYDEGLPKNDQFYPAVVRAALEETTVEAQLPLKDD
mgnify:CR=1 FL=1